MNLEEYQKEAMKFAKYVYADYPFLALGEEAGEVLGKLAKFGRKNSTSVDVSIDRAFRGELRAHRGLKNDLIKELGDLLWQLSACCNELGVSLEDVAKDNLSKLQDRSDRGVIVGEGDNR